MRQAIGAWESGDKRRSKDVGRALDLMLATGVRIGEVLGLRWQDVDLATTPATVTIAGAENWNSEEGHHRQDARKGHAQRGDDGLTLAIPSWATALLLEQRIAAGASEHVFPSRNGTLRSQNNFRTSLRKALVGTGFEGHVTPHVMRSTVATTVERAAGIVAASAQLDHSETAVTMRHYIAKPSVAPDRSAILESLAPEPTVVPVEG